MFWGGMQQLDQLKDGIPAVISFGSDMTLRWARQAGDTMFWARVQGVLSPRGNEYKVGDIWELQDGNSVTITNRLSALPGSLVGRMKKRLFEGYDLQESVEGPNLWTVFAGDRIVWAGPDRDGVHSENGALGLIDFKENALVHGEPFESSRGFPWLPTFGGFDQGEPSPEGKRLCQVGWASLKRLGPPGVFASDDQWRIG